MMNLVARAFTLSEFQAHVESVTFRGWEPKFIVVHNTSVPTQKQYRDWHNRPGWNVENWLKNLASYYSGLGWNGCPHLFVAYDKICVLNSLNTFGTHSPSWNKISWGVETVAEFDTELFNGDLKTNLVAALGILHTKAGLDPANFQLGVRGLHFHKEDIKTTHRNCPGKNLQKAELVADVVEYMNKGHGEGGHVHLSEAIQLADTGSMTYLELTNTGWLQKRLNMLGYNLTVDGVLGIKTKQAVFDFQIKYGLKTDGIAGPITRTKLFAVTNNLKGN